MGPGGHWQWKPTDETVPIRFLTSDIALLHDDSYLSIVKDFAANKTALETEFAAAWYKLVTRDMGPISRCKGPKELLPPPQPFQLSLPAASSTLLSNHSVFYERVRPRIVDLMAKDAEMGPLLVTLAYQCASTFRITDYSGGCAGGRIRLSPEVHYPENKGLEVVLEALAPIQRDSRVSFADLIVFSGTVALGHSAKVRFPFMSGRVDVEYVDSVAAAKLGPRNYYTNPVVAIKDSAKIMGLSLVEYVALMGRWRSLEHEKRVGYSGSYSGDQSASSSTSNLFFTVLLGEKWIISNSMAASIEYKASGKDNVVIRESDYALLQDNQLEAIVKEFAEDADLYLRILSQAWTKLMNADFYN